MSAVIIVVAVALAGGYMFATGAFGGKPKALKAISEADFYEKDDWSSSGEELYSYVKFYSKNRELMTVLLSEEPDDQTKMIIKNIYDEKTMNQELEVLLRIHNSYKAAPKEAFEAYYIHGQMFKDYTGVLGSPEIGNHMQGHSKAAEFTSKMGQVPRDTDSNIVITAMIVSHVEVGVPKTTTVYFVDALR